jgi:hypothetical protein
MKAFGDSITAGYGVPVGSGYISLLSSAIGSQITNFGVSGAQAVDQAASVYVSSGPATVLLGTNDHRLYGTDSIKRSLWGSVMAAEIAFLCLSSKVTAQQATLVSGSWENNTAIWGGSMNRRSWTQGSKLSATVSGTVVYVGYTVQQGIGGQFQVKIDGVFQGIYQSSGGGVGGPGYGPKLLRFPNLSSGSHAVEIECLTSGYPGGLVYVDWVAGNQQSDPKSVYVGNCIRMGAVGYATYTDTNDANVISYCNEIASRVAELQADGLKVKLVNVNTAIDPLNDLLSDGVHPNESGHVKLKNAFLAAIESQTVTYQMDGGKSLVLDIGDGVVRSIFFS